MTVADRVARVVVRCYPRAWRRRYADELLAVLEQSSAGWPGVLDLARSGVSEWLRASGVVRVLVAILWATACSRTGAIAAAAIANRGDLPASLMVVVSLAFLGVSIWTMALRERAYRLPSLGPRRLDAATAAYLSAVLICLEAAWRCGPGVHEAGWWLEAGPGLSWYATYYALTAWVRPPVRHTVATERAEADTQ